MPPLYVFVVPVAVRGIQMCKSAWSRQKLDSFCAGTKTCCHTAFLLVKLASLKVIYCGLKCINLIIIGNMLLSSIGLASNSNSCYEGFSLICTFSHSNKKKKKQKVVVVGLLCWGLWQNLGGESRVHKLPRGEEASRQSTSMAAGLIIQWGSWAGEALGGSGHRGWFLQHQHH